MNVRNRYSAPVVETQVTFPSSVKQSALQISSVKSVKDGDMWPTIVPLFP